MKTYLLNIKQLEKKLKPWRELSRINNNNINWIKVIRQTFGISLNYLAKKIGVTQPNITQIEKSALEETITIKTLKKLANAMDCDVIYAVVPREPINVLLENRARLVAKKKLEPIFHTMALEEQSLLQEDLKERYEDLVKELLSEHPKNLWNSHYD